LVGAGADAALERVVDHRAERLHGVRADEGAPVDEERGRAPDAERAGLGEVGFDVAGESPLGQAPAERVPLEPQLDRVRDQAILGESRLFGEEAIVVRPVSALGSGAPCRLRRLAGLAVRGERQILGDETYPAVVLLEDLLQRPLDAPAVGSFEIDELDDRDRRVFWSARHRGSHRQLDLSRRGPGQPGDQQ
jgi:hypothetical protein